MLTQETREFIIRTTKLSLQKIPEAKEALIFCGPAFLYERLLVHAPPDAKSQATAQDMRENPEETIKLLGSLLGMM